MIVPIGCYNDVYCVKTLFYSKTNAMTFYFEDFLW